VTIHEINVARFEYPELELDIVCGSGTYVRALGRDLGTALGTAAVMCALERTAIGEFSIADAVAPDELTSNSLPQHLQSPLAALPDLPRIELMGNQIEEIRNGRPIVGAAVPKGDLLSSQPAEWAAIDAAGKLVAILFEKRPGELWPALNFL
jgi:tRNA pseudouridine55 synthase